MAEIDSRSHRLEPPEGVISVLERVIGAPLRHGVVPQSVALLPGPAKLQPGFAYIQISGTEALDAGKFGSEIFGKPVNDLRAPPLGILPGQDIAPDRPIKARVPG